MKFNIPPFDERLLQTLYEECSKIEEKIFQKEDASELLKSFNSKVIHSTDLENIEGYMSYCSQEDFIKGLLTPKVEKDTSILKEDLIKLISLLMEAEGEEYEQNYWLEVLSTNLSPNISDMIFWPEDNIELSADEIYEKAKNDQSQRIIYL